MERGGNKWDDDTLATPVLCVFVVKLAGKFADLKKYPRVRRSRERAQVSIVKSCESRASQPGKTAFAAAAMGKFQLRAELYSRWKERKGKAEGASRVTTLSPGGCGLSLNGWLFPARNPKITGWREMQSRSIVPGSRSVSFGNSLKLQLLA